MPQQLDVFPSEIFNPNNPSHIEFITTEIVTFNRIYKKIWDFDINSVIPAGVSAVSALAFISTGFMGYILFVATTSAASLYAHQHIRPNLEDPYQNQLAKLVEIYRWCKTAGTGVTNNETFINLTKLLSPLLEVDELMIWKGREKLALSHDFKNIILAKNPDYEFESEKQESSSVVSRIAVGAVRMSTSLINMAWHTSADKKASQLSEVKRAKPVVKINTEERLRKNLAKQGYGALDAASQLARYTLYSYKPEYKNSSEKENQTSNLGYVTQFIRKLW